MHRTAYRNCKRFADKYLKSSEHHKILDVGSYDVNGSLQRIFMKDKWDYTGCDKEQGPNVDVVLEADTFPWSDKSFTCVVSSSCFEHDTAFWITFNEMERVTTDGGYIYLCTPSSGPYHGYPLDCWRFHKDAYKALEKWNDKMKLIESYIDSSDSKWKDNVGIFQKITE